MVKIILDSNFLFVPSQFKVDIFEELARVLNQRFEPVLLSLTYGEIQRLASEGTPKMRKHASLALKLTEKCRILTVERLAKESLDDVIVRVASEWKCPVATNDRMLRRRLKNISVPVIYLRQKSRLEVDGRV